MQVTRLDIRNLRRFDEVSLAPSPGLNVITGENGAGKTSVLEALHLIAYGRSFRGRVRDGVIKAGAPAVEVFVEWRDGACSSVRSGTDRDISVKAGTRVHKAGLRHSGDGWEGRLDGAAVSHLGELCAASAVVTFEPGSHALITGGADNRRRYLDWGLFHVERDFLALWRRYLRALKQRNALLKTRRPDAQLGAWEHELAEAGEPLGRLRQGYLEALQPYFTAALTEMTPQLADTRLEYHPGWRRDEYPLADALLLARDRDLAAGFTSVGPHRADWRLVFSALPGREALSRGQAKLAALAAILGQASHHASTTGEWPVIALDDLGSELDRRHQRRVLEKLAGTPVQVFLTGTEPPPSLGEAGVQAGARFHVERGQVVRLEGAP
ncbi:MAG: DNA replication/repair protein RecF [Proteobacteria bacterium]|nr:DNA replication/repair protein RecF [Pseudomonadota bacterium]